MELFLVPQTLWWRGLWEENSISEIPLYLTGQILGKVYLEILRTDILFIFSGSTLSNLKKDREAKQLLIAQAFETCIYLTSVITLLIIYHLNSRLLAALYPPASWWNIHYCAEMHISWLMSSLLNKTLNHLLGQFIGSVCHSFVFLASCPVCVTLRSALQWTLWGHLCL